MSNIKFGTMVQDIVDRVATDVAGKVSAVSKGAQRFNPGTLPIALISVGRIDAETATVETMSGRLLEITIPIEVVVVIRDTSPVDWLTDIILPLGGIVDTLSADSLLGGTCEDSHLTFCEPARLTLAGEGAGGKIYYGGLIGWQARVFYQG